MNKVNNDYIATQTEEGFHIVFHNSIRAHLEVTFDDLRSFVQKINQNIIEGKKIALTDEDEVLLGLWQMLRIPENTIH